MAQNLNNTYQTCSKQISTPHVIKQRRISSSKRKIALSKRNDFSGKENDLVGLCEKFIASNSVLEDICNFRLYPVICNRYDLYLSQRLSSFKEISFQGINKIIYSQTPSTAPFLSWCLSACDGDGSSFEDSDLSESFDNYFTKTFMDFSMKDFEVSHSSLSELLLWLSWMDDPIEYFKERKWTSNIVNILLNILKSKPKEPKVTSEMYSQQFFKLVITFTYSAYQLQ